jgi:hypothetical protein
MLPEAYEVALRLQAAGASATDISECLDVEPSAVEALLAVAAAKLRSLLAADELCP